MKRFMPQTLFGRLFTIIMVAMILVPVGTVTIFYERHWDTITRYMASNLAADIATVVDRFTPDYGSENLDEVALYGKKYFLMTIDWQAQSVLPEAAPQSRSTYAGKRLLLELNKRLSQPFLVDFGKDKSPIMIYVGYPEGVLSIEVSRKRVFSTTPGLFTLWSFGISFTLLAVASVVMRNQIRPIRRLSKAARQIGLGRPPLDYRIEGAFEIRQAGRAFQAMSNRIQRQIAERTAFLAGVSHDLRTPLTRLKLLLAMKHSKKSDQEINQNITEMEAMIDGYLRFASGAIGENVEDADIIALIDECLDKDIPPKSPVDFTRPPSPPPSIALRRLAVRRAIGNLVNNALIHGGRCFISIEIGDESIQVLIDDDGRGIPKDRREQAQKPFVRGIGEDDEPKPLGKGDGVGLGLSIAKEVALMHGGNLFLGSSPRGGLRVRLQLPI